MLRHQLDTARVVLESIKTRDPPPDKEPGLLTIEDRYPVVTEQQKVDVLEKFSVSYFSLFVEFYSVNN